MELIVDCFLTSSDTLAEAHANTAAAAEGNIEGDLADPKHVEQGGVTGETVLRLRVIDGQV